MGATRSGSPREVNPAGDRRAALPGTVARMPAATYPWDRPLGARVIGDGLVEVRVWAPGDERRVTVRIARAEHELVDEGLGVRSAVVPARPGDDYWLTLDGKRFPDPASRWQPRGLRGASRVVDHQGFSWTDDSFEPAPMLDAVLYELHVGTFTPEGTFDAVIPRLPELRALGVERPLGRERADVQLVEHRVEHRRRLEAVVGPREALVVDHPRGPAQPARLPAAGRVGKALAVERQPVVVAGPRRDNRAAHPEALVDQLVLGARDAHRHTPLVAGRPDAHLDEPVADDAGPERTVPG